MAARATPDAEVDEMWGVEIEGVRGGRTMGGGGFGEMRGSMAVGMCLLGCGWLVLALSMSLLALGLFCTSGTFTKPISIKLNDRDRLTKMAHLRNLSL
jgi:hypothetical protein